jgi:hypothetical protein
MRMWAITTSPTKQRCVQQVSALPRFARGRWLCHQYDASFRGSLQCWELEYALLPSEERQRYEQKANEARKYDNKVQKAMEEAAAKAPAKA